METEFDVIVIGGGFAGAATVYRLSQRGRFKILLLERESGCGQHASGKNACLLRQAGGDPRIAELVQVTLRALRQPPQDWAHPDVYRATGSLLLGKRAVLEGFQKILTKLGAEARLFNFGFFPEELERNLQRQLEAIRYECLLWTPGDGVVAALPFLQNLLDAAEQRGTRICCGQEVRSVSSRQAIWTVECADVRYTSRAVVNAAGPWADALGEKIGFAAKGLQPFRRHLYLSAEMPEWDSESPYLWDVEHEFYFRPEAGGLLLCSGDEEPHPARSPEVDPGEEGRLRGKLRNFYPALAAVRVRRAWACLRTFWKNGGFLVAPEAGAPGFFWVAGLGGHGVGTSLGIGTLAAGQVEAFLNRQGE